MQYSENKFGTTSINRSDSPYAVGRALKQQHLDDKKRKTRVTYNNMGRGKEKTHDKPASPSYIPVAVSAKKPLLQLPPPLSLKKNVKSVPNILKLNKENGGHQEESSGPGLSIRQGIRPRDSSRNVRY